MFSLCEMQKVSHILSNLKHLVDRKLKVWHPHHVCFLAKKFYMYVCGFLKLFTLFLFFSSTQTKCTSLTSTDTQLQNIIIHMC